MIYNLILNRQTLYPSSGFTHNIAVDLVYK